MSNDFSNDPSEEIRRMFVNLTQKPRILAGQRPAKRAVFLKQHGVAYGTFAIKPDLPESLRVGLFRYDKFPCWVRFSSDTLPGASDLKTTVGCALKLFEVPGRKVSDWEPNAKTHDFILQNFDVFFVNTAKDMCEFTRAGVVNHNYDAYLQTHPVTKQILNEMAREVTSVLQIDYWSALPYAFGPDRYVKYKLSPCSALESKGQSLISASYNDYLSIDLRERLLSGDATFSFELQFRTEPDQMPLDQATVRWSEALSKPIATATVILPRQDTNSQGQAEYGENLAFNPWHALPEHEPVGSLSEARKVTYNASARIRRQTNGISMDEPATPRSPVLD